MRNKIRIVILGVIVACLGVSIDANAAGPGPGPSGPQPLTEGDRAYLIFMRSEEKLARDVYLTLGAEFLEAPIFKNIACQSEQIHTEQVRILLEKYKITDPEPATVYEADCDDVNDIGVFQTDYFQTEAGDEYFADKYDKLTYLDPDDPAPLLTALKYGAKIEELDMKDINFCNIVIYEAFGFPYPPPDYCGLTVTDVRAIENTLTSLLEGSENHLCGFVGQILPLNNGCYENQLLTATEVGDIISANCPELFDAWGDEETVCDYTYIPPGP